MRPLTYAKPKGRLLTINNCLIVASAPLRHVVWKLAWDLTNTTVVALSFRRFHLRWENRRTTGRLAYDIFVKCMQLRTSLPSAGRGSELCLSSGREYDFDDGKKLVSAHGGVAIESKNAEIAFLHAQASVGRVVRNRLSKDNPNRLGHIMGLMRPERL